MRAYGSCCSDTCTLSSCSYRGMKPKPAFTSFGGVVTCARSNKTPTLLYLMLLLRKSGCVFQLHYTTSQLYPSSSMLKEIIVWAVSTVTCSKTTKTAQTGPAHLREREWSRGPTAPIWLLA